MCAPWNHKFEEVGEREFGELWEYFFGGLIKNHVGDYTKVNLQCTKCGKFTQQELSGHIVKQSTAKGGFKCTNCHRSFITYVHAGTYDYEELLDVTYAYTIPVPNKRA